ncbi:MAG: M20 family metallopeptidase [Propioniciclava sp.]
MSHTEWESRVLSAIDASAEELIELLGALLRTDSQNPPGDCTQVAQVVSGYLDSHGVSNQILSAGDGRDNVVSFRPAEGPRHLVLAGHHDTVPIGDASRWSFPPLAGDVVDGYARGRGASDMKGGLAGIIFVYVLLHRLGVPLGGSLTLASTADEETGGAGGAPWLLDGGVLDRVTGGIIAEPAERTHPTIGQKGSNWFKLTIQGKPGHGSLQPLHGVSATLLGARAALALQRLWDLEARPPADVQDLIASSKRFAEEREGYAPGIGEVFSHVTVNIGTITGGVSANVVADTCELEVDTRVPIGIRRQAVLDRVHELLAAEGIEATITPLGFQSEPNYTLPSDPVVETLVDAIRELTGDAEAAGVLQWASSDARAFRQHGIPVLQYGPAVLHTIHGIDERVKVDDVVLSAKVYALAVLRYLGISEQE